MGVGSNLLGLGSMRHALADAENATEGEGSERKQQYQHGAALACEKTETKSLPR